MESPDKTKKKTFFVGAQKEIFIFCRAEREASGCSRFGPVGDRRHARPLSQRSASGEAR
jgi:hypothetical protein